MKLYLSSIDVEDEINNFEAFGRLLNRRAWTMLSLSYGLCFTSFYFILEEQVLFASLALILSIVTLVLALIWRLRASEVDYKYFVPGLF